MNVPLPGIAFTAECVARIRRGARLACGFAVVFACCSTPMPCAAGQGRPPASLKELAAAAQGAGKDEAAIVLYRDALVQDPNWAEGWWRYGGLLYEARRFAEAAQGFTHSIRLAPSNPLGLALLGMCEYELGDWSNAALHLNKAFALGGLPQEIANAAMYDLGLTLMQQHNRSGALIALRLLQHNAPAFPNLEPALGSAELGLAQIAPPDSTDRAAVMLAGAAGLAVLNLRSDDAERDYRELVQHYPNLPYAHLCLALFLENQGKHVGAEAELTAETRVNRTTPDAWIWLARLALARRDAAATLHASDEAMRLTPNNGVCFLLSGRAYMLQQKWADALNTLQRAEALAPDSYEVHHALISVYGELHDSQGADSERKLFAQTFTTSHPPQTDAP